MLEADGLEQRCLQLERVARVRTSQNPGIIMYRINLPQQQECAVRLLIDLSIRLVSVRLPCATVVRKRRPQFCALSRPGASMASSGPYAADPEVRAAKTVTIASVCQLCVGPGDH